MTVRISRLRKARAGRASSWDTTGGNADQWLIPAGETKLLADIKGPGRITHIWMTQKAGYREVLLRFYFDNEDHPQIDVPLGDFFCLGHGITNSFQSLYFTASANHTPQFGLGCALNCYLPMPFHESARVELVNESDQEHMQYFYIDYETCCREDLAEEGYLHAEFRRANPFSGWGPGVSVKGIACEREWAWENNYVILETKGRGHYIGCNMSITNLNKGWWGEGDDMIWVDGYKWPPDLHGTGSEDYFGQAWSMQPNAFLRNGSSIFENETVGYQTSYVFHPENPVYFNKEIKVTMEHGHANHSTNEVSSVAYWYAEKPCSVAVPPPAAQRLPIRRDHNGRWIDDPDTACPGPAVKPTPQMMDRMKEQHPV